MRLQNAACLALHCALNESLDRASPHCLCPEHEQVRDRGALTPEVIATWLRLILATSSLRDHCAQIVVVLAPSSSGIRVLASDVVVCRVAALSVLVDLLAVDESAGSSQFTLASPLRICEHRRYALRASLQLFAICALLSADVIDFKDFDNWQFVKLLLAAEIAELIGLESSLRSKERPLGRRCQAGELAGLGALDLLGAGLPQMAHVLGGRRIQL